MNITFIFSLLRQFCCGTTKTHAPISPATPYIRTQGIVTEAILPGSKGRIRVHGVYWYGRVAAPVTQTIPAGSIISVLHRDGLTLTVQLVSLPPANVLPFKTPRKRHFPNVSSGYPFNAENFTGNEVQPLKPRVQSSSELRIRNSEFGIPPQPRFPCLN